MAKNWFVGWNMPGYLPDTEPYQHDSWEDAQQDLIEELNRAADCHGADDPKAAEPYDAAVQQVMRAEHCEPFLIIVGNYAWWINAEESSHD